MSDETRERVEEIQRAVEQHEIDFALRRIAALLALLQPQEPVGWAIQIRPTSIPGAVWTYLADLMPTQELANLRAAQLYPPNSGPEVRIVPLYASPQPSTEREREAIAEKVSWILRAVLRGDHVYRGIRNHVRWGLVEKDMRNAILNQDPDHE